MGGRALVLIVLTGTNFGLAYLTGILLARTLGIGQFDDYAVAVAAVTMRSTLAEFGTGKYGMRVLPVYHETQQWGLARGYRLFARYTILLVSGVLVGIYLVPDLVADPEERLSVGGAAVLFLPVMALVGCGAEIVQANLATVRAAILSRIVVPGATLLGIVLWTASGRSMSAMDAVVLFGAGWAVGWVVLRLFLQQTTPPEVGAAEPVRRNRSWIVEVLPFLAFALLVVALAKAGLVVLKAVAADEEASVFAAALETGSFLYLIAKSTDKMFLPQLSVMIEHKDAEAMRRGRRQRLTWVGAVALVFLGAMVLFGRDVLGLFGPGFERGYGALVIVSAATAVWTLFSLAPSYLKYVNKKRFVVQGTAIAVAANLLLTWWLGARHGAVGAAIAYGLPIVGLYGTFAWMAGRELRRIMASEGASERSLEEEDAEEFPF